MSDTVAEGKEMGLLAGLQVLDLADEKASFCSKLLADLGAEVIKIEKPGGDASRWKAPFWENRVNPETSLSFWYNNTNKRGITLNLESDRGKNLFRRLISRADIVVESFPPGYLRGLGLGYEELSKINSGLILASITGFGQDGPYRQYKSCDVVASAQGGQMHVCGAPDTPPLKPYGEQSYYVASLFAAVGILIALRERNHSRKGQHIDISMQEAVAATLEHVMVRYFYQNVVANRQGNVHWNNSCCILDSKDGYILLTFDREWETLVGWLDSEGMAEDLKEEKWCEEEYRRQHLSHILEILGRWTRNHTTGELFELAQLMHFPWAPVSSISEMLNSPQLKERNFFVSIDHPETGLSFIYPSAPYKFSQSSCNIWKRAPLIGEHNGQIYGKELSTPLKQPARLADKMLSEQAGSVRDALQGIRVLDFTWLLAGPYATRLLADFGAEIIKIQSKKTASGAESNATGYFNMWNRNKLSITLDMSYPEAKKIALKLVRISDVVVENFTPRVMSNWGLSYETLKEVKPDLIMASMSGMGHTGPWRDFVALGPTIQALSGMTYLTSFGKDAPLGLGYSYADSVAGLFAALAILASLEYRDRTGQGQYIDISEYEAMCSLLGPAILDYSINGNLAKPQGNNPDYILAAPYGCYQCRGNDRWCVIAVSTEAEWHALCQALGLPAWTREKKFSTLSQRKEYAEELNELLEQWTTKHTPEEVMSLLQKAGVPCGVVSDAADLANDQQLESRGFFIQLPHPVLGNTRFDSTPIRLSRTPAQCRWSAPLLGQDNHYVYQKLLGMDKQQLSYYIEKGIIS